MKNYEFSEKSIYNIIVLVFIIIGLLYKFVDKRIPPNFIVLVVFLTLKMIFNYKKCTFSYLECKIRKVKREDGFLASLLDHVVDLNKTKYIYAIYALSFFFIINAPVKEIFDFEKIESFKKSLNFKF